MDYEFLRFDVEQHVAKVTFASPDTGNKYRKDQEWELLDVLARIQKDPDVHVATFSGEGDEFGGGSDRRGDPYVASEYYERAHNLFDAWSRVDVPALVALHSPALLTLPLLSDIVVTEAHVDFVDTHVVAGITAATGAFLWPMSTGLNRARRYLLTGDRLSAVEAERIGLVAEVVESGASKARVAELAAQIAALPNAGVRMTKRALNEWVRQSWGPIFKHALSLEFIHFLTPAEYEALVSGRQGA